MKVLLFGSRGQVGSEIVKRIELDNSLRDSPIELHVTDAPELDICEPLAVNDLVHSTHPDVIINCAAYTQVDRAEEAKDIAFSVNAYGAAHIAWSAKTSGAYMIQLSTDYVFDGRATRPMTEDHPTNPISVYGESKLLGEKEVLHLLPSNSVVLRTSSVHGASGINFVHTMIKLMREKDEIKVVHDQIMCTTWAGWLAEVILDLCEKKPSGIVNACSQGPLSWYEFAKQIQQRVIPTYPEASKCKIIPVSSAEFVRPAKRPQYSAMDCTKLRSIQGKEAITWKDGLDFHLADLGIG